MTLKRRAYEPGAAGPLKGVRVLDLSRLVAGNTLTALLADFGADVVKVESGEGDTLRAWRTAGVQANWKLYARNKRSVALDLRKPAGLALLLDLVERAQVFVESARPGTLEEMGLGPAELLERNPKLVIVRISGFAAMNGFPDREPVLPPMYMADSYAGLYGAAGVLVALREVEVNGGRGQVIDLPLLDPLFTVLGPQAANYRLTREVKPRTGSRSTNSGPRNAYRTSDGKYVALSASTQKMSERVMAAIGRADLIDDPRFRTNADRVKNAEALDAVIGAFVARKTQAENVAFFEQAEVTIGPIYDIAQILEDPHFIEREVLADYPDADMGAYPMHHVVPRLEGTPGSIRAPAPKLGEHNREVLGELGVDAARYAALLAEGVVREE